MTTVNYKELNNKWLINKVNKSDIQKAIITLIKNLMAIIKTRTANRSDNLDYIHRTNSNIGKYIEEKY